MKSKNPVWRIKVKSGIWLASAAVLCLLPVRATGKDEATKNDEAADDEEVSNWADFTLGGVAVGGDHAAFQRAARQTDGFYGGISSMRWEKEMDDLTLLIEGHALMGMEDYDITARLDKKDLGYVRAGFRQYRTWYEGTGAYVPGVAASWVPIYGEDELSVDRGKLWFEAGLRMEHLPEITFGYSHEWRDGTKDSTTMGVTDPDPYYYGIVPTLFNMDERRDTFTLDFAYTLGNTDLGLGLRYENVSNEDTRIMHNQPGSLLPTSDRTTSQSEEYDSDLFGAHIFSETRFNDKMLMSFGYSYTTMNTDTTGSSRTVVDRAGTPYATTDNAFSALTGGAQLSLNVANANFWWNPIADLVIVPSFRASWEDMDAISAYVQGTNKHESSDSEIDNTTEQLEVRYTGLDNLVLYGKVEMSQEDGTILYRDINDSMRLLTSDITEANYVLGTNWYPMRGLSLAAQYYHKSYDEKFNDTFKFNPLLGNPYDEVLKSHNVNTDDLNLRLTWRAMPNLTLVSRYDYQHSTIENQGLDAAGVPLNTIDSADINRNVFSESITWMPVDQAYVQGSVSYVLAQTDTPANVYAPFRIADSANDYVTANITAGYALDKKTDIQASYTYFYSNDNSVPYDKVAGVPGSVPFGSEAQENIISVSLNRRITPNMIWNMGYSYYNSSDDASGGYNNFHAHMVSTGLQVRF